MTATPPTVTQAMIDLYDRFTHDGTTSRRELMAGLARLAGSTAAAATLLPLIAARAEAAPLSNPEDSRLETDRLVYAGPAGQMVGYLARPKRASRAEKVLVIHENRGLNDHVRDVARRLALAGFVALAPDFLSRLGETPRSGNGTQSAEDIARQMIGSLPREAAVADALSSLAFLDGYSEGRAVPGAVGFCWGGGMVNALAVAAGAKLRAGVVYYGPSPAEPATVAARVKARMLFHYAGLDERINATAPAWTAALTAAGVKTDVNTWPGVNHAFNNDTSEARYDRTAAEAAWAKTIAWLQ